MKTKKRIAIFAVIFSFLASFIFAQPAGGGGGNRGGGPGAGGSSRPGVPSKKPSVPKSKSSGSKSKITAFNGMRVGTEHESFHVVLIEVEKKSVQVTFNIPVNASTFTHENILINGEPLEKDVKIKFNKTGKLVEIKIALGERTESKIEFKDVKSYDNESLAVQSFDKIIVGKKQEYTLPEESKNSGDSSAESATNSSNESSKPDSTDSSQKETD